MRDIPCMETKYPQGAIAYSQIGPTNHDRIFYRISKRIGERIVLSPLKPAFTLKGNLVPGEIDPHAKPLRRKITRPYGNELLAPVVVGHFVAGIKPWGYPRPLMPRGGKRVGAGRKKGSGTGRNVVSKSVSLTQEEWREIEKIKGSEGISEFFRKRIFGQKKVFEKNP